MQTTLKRASGFTMVELLIVIVVIAILATIGVFAYNVLTARASDTERETDIKNVSKKLAQFRILNQYYPRYDDVANNNLVWVKTNLPGINSDAFVAPGAGSDTNSFSTTGSPALNVYTYRPYFDDNDGFQRVCAQSYLTTYGKSVQDCDRYDLRYREQQTNTIRTIKSRWGW